MSYFYSQYFCSAIYAIVCLLLAIIIACFAYVISLSNPDSNKLGAYECGFNPYDDARNTFDIQFYVVAILFLVFDIELMFLLPWSVSLSFLSPEGIWCAIEFMIELLVGYVYVYIVGALDWK